MPTDTKLDLTVRLLNDLAACPDPRVALSRTAEKFNLPAGRIREMVQRYGWPNPGSMGRAAAVLERKLQDPMTIVEDPAPAASPRPAKPPVTAQLPKPTIPGAPVGRMIRVDKLVPHPSNPAGRVDDITDLVDSIRETGIATPLMVTPHPNRLGHFLILAGHRRHAAALKLGLTEVPCTERACAGDLDEQLVLMLIENVQRLDLNPMDKAEAFGQFLDRGFTHGQIEKRTGVKVGVIRHYLPLLDLDQTTRELVRSGDLGVMDAIARVKEARGDARRKSGRPQRGRPVQLDPAWLTMRHPLASIVKANCDHRSRPVVGRAGCGQCWEQAIRADERTTDEAVS
ncbi:MAG TPA: ParB/RepB/Spo0J family partition protein [Kribbella sp.]